MENSFQIWLTPLFCEDKNTSLDSCFMLLKYCIAASFYFHTYFSCLDFIYNKQTLKINLYWCYISGVNKSKIRQGCHLASSWERSSRTHSYRHSLSQRQKQIYMPCSHPGKYRSTHTEIKSNTHTWKHICRNVLANISTHVNAQTHRHTNTYRGKHTDKHRRIRICTHRPDTHRRP